MIRWQKIRGGISTIKIKIKKRENKKRIDEKREKQDDLKNRWQEKDGWDNWKKEIACKTIDEKVGWDGNETDKRRNRWDEKDKWDERDKKDNR